MDPKFFRKYADLITEASAPAIDPQETYNYAQKIVAALNQQFGGGFSDRPNQDGSITIVQDPKAGPADPYNPQYENDPDILTPRSVSRIIDPYYRAFRQQGWRFDQPVGGKFTIAVPQQST